MYADKQSNEPPTYATAKRRKAHEAELTIYEKMGIDVRLTLGIHCKVPCDEGHTTKTQKNNGVMVLIHSNFRKNTKEIRPVYLPLLAHARPNTLLMKVLHVYTCKLRLIVVDLK